MDLAITDPASPVSARLYPVESRQAARRSRPRGLFALLAADFTAAAIALLIGPTVASLLLGRWTVPVYGRLIYAPVYLVVMSCYGLYRRGRRRLVGSSFPDITHIAHAIIVASVLSLVAENALRRVSTAPELDAWEAAVTGLFALVAVTQTRGVARWVVRRTRKERRSRALIVGSGVVAKRVMLRLDSIDELEIVGWVDDDLFAGQGTDMGDLARLGGLGELAEVVRANEVDHVVVAFSPAAGSTLAGLLRELSDEARISIVPRLFDLLSVRSHIDDLRGLPVVDVAPPSLGPADRFAKRAVDLVASVSCLVVLVPVITAIAIAIKLTSPGPVLFSQERCGRHRKVFRIHKFRTMYVGSDSLKAENPSDMEGPLFKIRRDPRVTPVGAFLRRTSLDELPQLFNVVKGQMSLVGPRPFVPGESNEIVGWAARRYDVRPGMTGLWQVSGRSDLPFEELCRLDYSYVASWSLWWDLHILWQTPGMVLRGHGAY